MIKKNIIEFLIEAKRATYAGNGPEKLSSRPNSHDLEYEREFNGRDISDMLKRVPLQTISELHRRTGIKQTEPAIFTRFPYFEYFEKHNPRDIILMNSTLQVLVAMTYHNEYYSGCHDPFQFEFTSPKAYWFRSL
ncbi:hypothetical protein [Desulfosporosinus sp. FKB]|uniref:hypothetical protein n=1 Tax=Desulfosporosinus sp. FKB TaxID=1969835 RepID=UPI001FA89C27|nr:hypothetical protein [Desulfosporosinus sp. FKB]